MKLNNLTMSSTKAFTFVHGSQDVTDLLQSGWDVRLDYLLIPPLTDPTLVQIPGFTALVQNGSASTVKWPVTGAFSKWNALEYPYNVISNGVEFVDKFNKVKNSILGEWHYLEPIEPLLEQDFQVYYKSNFYDPVKKVGTYIYETADKVYHMDDRTFVRSFGLYKDTIIRFCPSFDLPKRIQLRITLVRVKEN